MYSGGGIEPDRFKAGPIEGFDPAPLGRRLFARQAFPRYAQKYSEQGDTRFSDRGRDRVSVERGFDVTDAMVEDFKAFLEGERFTFDAEEFADDEAFIRAMIRYYIDWDLFGVVDARRHLVEVDPQAIYALGLFADAKALTLLSQSGRPAAP